MNFTTPVKTKRNDDYTITIPTNDKIIELNGNRRLINAVKKAGIKTYNPKGEWNGYGYIKLPLVAEVNTEEEINKFNSIFSDINKKNNDKPKKDKKEEWAKRLSKLTDINYEQALEIANEKLDAKEREIENLMDKQLEHYSVQRQKLINAKERENPLRIIKDKEHAENILIASKRHNNGYDQLLKEAHEMEKWGELEKGDAREWARNKYYKQQNSQSNNNDWDESKHPRNPDGTFKNK